MHSHFVCFVVRWLILIRGSRPHSTILMTYETLHQFLVFQLETNGKLKFCSKVLADPLGWNLPLQQHTLAGLEYGYEYVRSGQVFHGLV